MLKMNAIITVSAIGSAIGMVWFVLAIDDPETRNVIAFLAGFVWGRIFGPTSLFYGLSGRNIRKE